MKAIVHMLVTKDTESLLVEKIIELGYIPKHVWRGEHYQVYMTEMPREDFLMLKLSIPFIEVDEIINPIK